KGFLRGTQNQLNCLPEQHTDFIFSVFAEEWGLVGALVLIALYVALVLRGIVIATRARDRFGVLLVLGLTATVFWQAVINVGMTTGLLPVVGIPLPFFSYGGSSLLCLLVGVGLTMNVSMRRYFFVGERGGASAQRERRGRRRSASAPARPIGRACVPSRRSEAETAAPPLAPPAHARATPRPS